MKIDGRTLSHETSETIRRMAVQRVRDGERPSEVIASYGLCRTTIYRWLRAHEKGGEQALASRRGTGRPVTLTNRQKQHVRKWICGRDPRQYGFDFGLWTRQIVTQLIEQKFGITLSVATVGRLLAELEITPQKPLRRAYERDPEAIEKWQREEFPKLRARAKRRGADIFFLDEAGIRSDAPLQRTWGAKGKTPVVATSGQRQSVNAISAVTMRGGFWYAVYTGRFNAGRFVEFLKAFLRGRRCPVMLVVDGHPAHRAKVVADFVQSTKGQLELHFLPGYAPELNPDEFVWNHLRQCGVSKKPLRRGESLRARVEGDLHAIQRRPSLVRSFFHADSVAYIMS
ncbi:MAG: IS630 family transposase [Candidatus Hydrogenedentes bacterium]|nr:IS630 family transposase [Candidatus Hydrogenedentota bacterium]